MLSGRRDYRGYIYHPGCWTPLAQTHHHALVQTPQVWWYGTDTTGAPVELTDAAGKTVWRAQRLAWGNLREETWLAEGADNCLRLPGQYEDRETGLFYNLHRYYDPRHGRYITPDPVGLTGGLNPYVYVDGNPVSWIDPLGLLKTESTGFENINAKSDIPELVDIYRAVGPNELSDIRSTGAFNNVEGIETKYFTKSGEKASEYAKKAVSAFGDEPYTIVKAEISKNTLENPIFFAEVDGGIPAYVLPSNILVNLKPIILNYSPVSGE